MNGFVLYYREEYVSFSVFKCEKVNLCFYIFPQKIVCTNNEKTKFPLRDDFVI